MSGSYSHTPVLLNSVLSILDPKKGDNVLDATIGLGGHARAFLSSIGSQGKLFGLDADQENLSVASRNLSAWEAQIALFHANFRDLSSLLLPSMNVIFADLGLSSPHVDDPGRGFTFRENIPLDLRFDRTKGRTAVEWLESVSLEELMRVFREYGELRGTRRLAERLKEGNVRTTFDVSSAAEAVFGWKARKLLPQVFQALRITVNDELNALTDFLDSALALLAPGGRLGVISFHSLEDRLVKQMFRSVSTQDKDPETGHFSSPAEYILLTKKPVIAHGEEVEGNPRSRSAKFRAILKAPFPDS